MKTILSSFLIVLLFLSLSACSNSDEDNYATSSQETLVEGTAEDSSKTCYVCGIQYNEGGYNINVGSQSIDLCKECRDELLIKNGFIVIDGKKEYPFDDYTLYKDELVTIPVPDDYHLTDVSDEIKSDIWKAEFHYNDDNDIIIMFGWEDFFEGVDERPSTEERLDFDLQHLYENYDSDSDADAKLADFFAVEEYVECYSLDVQGIRYLAIFYSGGLTGIYTINDGVIYYYVAANMSDTYYEEDEQPEPSLDMLTMTATVVYPSAEDVISLFDSTDNDNVEEQVLQEEETQANSANMMDDIVSEPDPTEYTSQGTPINDGFKKDSIPMEKTDRSSCFSEIGYDASEGLLVVTFRSSGVSYLYYGVPEDVWDAFSSADSIGGYYNEKIKSEYTCEKLK